jgi:hypothetical protein
MHFIKPQTLNLKPYHLLYKKEKSTCIKINVRMWGAMISNSNINS